MKLINSNAKKISVSLLVVIFLSFLFGCKTNVPVIRKITFLDFVQLQMVMSVNCQRWKQVLPVCICI